MRKELPSFLVVWEYMVDITKEKESIRQAQDLAAGERVRVEPEIPTAESPRKAETPLEVESWITKIEKRLGRIPQGKAGVQDDQVIVQQPMSKQPPVKLPINSQQMQVGKKAKTENGIAWLVAWAIRQIKMMARLGRKIEMAEIPEVKEEK